jgi:hypothetical protein
MWAMTWPASARQTVAPTIPKGEDFKKTSTDAFSLLFKSTPDPFVFPLFFHGDILWGGAPAANTPSSCGRAEGL